jgi:hypothetical protein
VSSTRTSPADGSRKPIEDLDRRRLAGAVGPEQAHHLAAVDGEVHAGQDLVRAVGHPQAANLHDRVGVGFDRHRHLLAALPPSR